MKIHSTYSCKIRHYSHIFEKTVSMYRNAVDFFINVCNECWSDVAAVNGADARQMLIEKLTHRTGKRPDTPFDFDKSFYKFPSYLRRSAISEAIGKVSSYRSNLMNWEASDPDSRGKKPSFPKAGYVYPCMYRDNMFARVDDYTARIKVYIHNTWDWITVSLKKSDVDYIRHHCSSRKECAPTLQKRGKEWFLDFPFEEEVTLNKTDVTEQTIAAVDLGINNACTVCIMHSDGTIVGRKFLSLPSEQDSLMHAVNRIRKAQQRGNHRTPGLWAKAKGINDRIAVLTARFIMDQVVQYNADVIVFEHLDRKGKIRGPKKQKLQLWRSQYVQEMVMSKAHRLGMRISHVCARGTSKLAYDGSGSVLRGEDAGLKSYSVCKFSTGKVYNCDLNAAYNIGSRYFIREILKSLPETERLSIEAKVPQCIRRSTCTLSTLISLNAVLAA